jgi:hypothetical protein
MLLGNFPIRSCAYSRVVFLEYLLYQYEELVTKQKNLDNHLKKEHGNMGQGTKNYFRHSTNARNDEKILNLISKERLKREGYFFFFTLCEIYAEKCEGLYKSDVRIHASILRDAWKTKTNKIDFILDHMCQCELITYENPNKSATECEQSTEGSRVKGVHVLGTPLGQVSVHCTESGRFKGSHVLGTPLGQTTENNPNYVYSIGIPSIEKYMGKYTFLGPNKNKIKEKKIKENKINQIKIKDKNKNSENSEDVEVFKTVTQEEVINAYNKIIGDDVGKSYRLNSFGMGEANDNYLELVKQKPFSEIQGWKDLFNQCKASEFLMEICTHFNLMWILSKDNLYKIIAGSFNNNNAMEGMQ